MGGWRLVRIWLGTRTHGRLVEGSDAQVSVLDHGFTVADGVFETLKVTRAGAFAVTRHLRRLASSAEVLALQPPELDVVRGAIHDAVDAWRRDGGEMGRLRVTFTAGPAPLGSDRGDAEPTLVVAVTDTTPWPETTSAITVPWTRNERSAVVGAKTTSYAENVVALREAHARGASEAILANTRGHLCEGTGTNVFIVRDGQLLTPSLASGCLPGITRELVLEWFGGEEAELPLAVLHEADEVLLTSSTRDVHPVVRVDGRSWHEVGPAGARLRRDFATLCADDIDP